VVIAIAVVAFLLLGQSYTVVAEFENAGQLVKGNPVQISGNQIGTVTDIEIAPNSHVYVKMSLKGPHTPLKAGTKAQIRQLSLSSIAGRYIDLEPPTEPASMQTNATIPEGGRIPATDTKTPVDIDQLFNTLDPVARASIQDLIKGSAKQWKGKGPEANRGLQYLNPTFSTSRRLFNELTSDKVLLRRFIGDSAKFMTAVAERREDLAGAVQNLNTTTAAIASEKAALQEAIGRLPDFMRTANTTFVNVRSTLNDLDPLVNASKPVAPKLERLLEDLRPFARDARPTVRDLDNIVRRPGRDNDLVELDRTLPPLADIALDTKRRSMAPGGRRFNVGTVRGAFPESAEALTESVTGRDGRGGRLGAIPTLRPYTPDLFGWFDDFSTTGAYDALGGISRTQIYINFLDRLGVTPVGVPGGPSVPDFLEGIGFGEQAEAIRAGTNQGAIRTRQARRCPGASEAPAGDGSNVWSSSTQAALQCRESDRATKPR
jgi:phospholipid/cholesterol/gamma-HCH transport system substrate-binding protein